MADPLQFFKGLKRDDPKVLDFCKARCIQYPDENTPKIPGINNEYIYHPHAPKFSHYTSEKAFFKDFVKWGRANGNSLTAYLKDQKTLGDINQWKFGSTPPISATNYQGLSIQDFGAPKFPTPKEYQDLIKIVEHRGEIYYKKLREEAKASGKGKRPDSKKGKSPGRASASPSTGKSKQGESSKALALINNPGVDDSGEVVNPKDYLYGDDLSKLGVKKSDFQILIEMMRKKKDSMDSDLNIGLGDPSMSNPLIDLNEPNPLDSIDNSLAIGNILDANKIEATKTMLTNIEVESEMKIQMDIERAKTSPQVGSLDNPFSFDVAANQTKIADLNIGTKITPVITPTPIQVPTVTIDQPTTSKAATDNAISSVNQLLTNEEECQLRDKAGITRDQVDIDLLVLKSGYLNKDLSTKTDTELRFLIINTSLKVKVLFQKYLIGASINGDNLPQSIREISTEVGRVSTKLSETLYMHLVKLPSMRNEIKFNFVMSHFCPFLFINILSFDSAANTTREINTGLAFSNMTHVSSTIQKLVVKVGTLTSTMETVMTQNLVLNGLMYSSLSDFSKVTQDLSAKMSKAEYAHIKKQVINPESMQPSRLQPISQTPVIKKMLVKPEECSYLVFSFMIIPITPKGCLEPITYMKIMNSKKNVAKEAYELLKNSSLIVFESLARIKDTDALKTLIRELIQKYKDIPFTDSDIFQYIQSKKYQMTSTSKTFNYEAVKHLIPA